jgi:hypothetical protein
MEALVLPSVGEQMLLGTLLTKPTSQLNFTSMKNRFISKLRDPVYNLATGVSNWIFVTGANNVYKHDA